MIMEKASERLKKLFSECESRFGDTPFRIPEGAHEERIHVFRACRSGKCEKESFLPTFEEQAFRYRDNDDVTDPGVYSLSVYEKPNHIKRFASHISDMNVPYRIAEGYTEPEYGLVQRTKERKAKSGSHVDWWLYPNKDPSVEFVMITDFDEFLDNYNNGS